jgi:hypothetical protein
LEETTRISMTLDEVTAFKQLVTGDASFADRISLGFAIRLAWLHQKTGDDRGVLFEIQHLEQGVPTTTKPAEQFKHAPLRPFWHKHFFCSRHLLYNVGERWNIARGHGNRDLDAMIKQVASEQGHDPAMWPKLLTYRLVKGGIEERSEANRLTGDWIIFAQHVGNNYYLDLATHEEGEVENAPGLLNKLRNSSSTDFPFLFDGQ